MERATLRAGALTVHAAVDRPSGYAPGELVHAAVAVSAATDAPAPLPVGTLVLVCTGIQYVDPHWAPTAARSDADAALGRGERYTFRTRAVTLLSDCTLSPGELRSFRLQFSLPPGLPPSFRGTFARFSYALSVTLAAGPGGAAGALSLPFRVWPAPEGPAAPPAADAAQEPPAAVPPSEVCDVLSWEDGDAAAAAAAAAAAWEADGTHAPGAPQPPPSPESPRIGASDRVSPLFGTPLLPPGAGADMAAVVPPATPRRSSLDAVRSPGGGPQVALSLGGISLNGGAPAAAATPRRSGSLAASGGVATSPLAMSDAAAPPRAAQPPARAAAYQVRVGTAPLVRVALRRPGPAAAAGGVLAGTLDFANAGEAAGSGAALRCTAVSISLDTEERLLSAAEAAAEAGDGAAATTAAAGGRTLCVVRDECAEAVPDTLQSSFSFSLPRDAPPTFAAGPVRHAWRLAFDFALQPAAGGGAAKTDTLRWSLPVTVAAPAHRPQRDAAAAAQGTV